MMPVALQIPCITNHYYPATLDNLTKMCALAGFSVQTNPQSTCCGLPYFEKGELKTAKSIGELNLKVFAQDKMVCCSTKCYSTYSVQYPKIFNNTVSHNEAVNLSKNLIPLSEICNKLSNSHFSAIEGHFFIVQDCCSISDIKNIVKRMDNALFVYPTFNSTCCGAGASMPSVAPSVAAEMTLVLIYDFLDSGAEAMVFEDDICRKQVDLVAQSKNIALKTFHVIDLIMKNSHE